MSCICYGTRRVVGNCHRIAHWAFRFATHRRRKKITVFHKANIMKMSDGLFITEARKTHTEDYPNIKYNEMIIDAGGFTWKVHSTSMQPEGSRVGLSVVPFNIHIMRPMEEAVAND